MKVYCKERIKARHVMNNDPVLQCDTVLYGFSICKTFRKTHFFEICMLR